MNLVKNLAIHSKLYFLEIKGEEIKNNEKIMKNLYQFYENLFSNDVPVSNKNIPNYVKD